jgi:hypothetical protein
MGNDGDFEGVKKIQAFISHSSKDKNGKTFVNDIFGGIEGNSAHFYSYQGVKPPHAEALKGIIQKECKALFVLLSEYLLLRPYTASWVSYEVGLAHASGMNVWVFENIQKDPIKIPIPYVSAYVQRKNDIISRSTFPYDFIGDFAGTVIPQESNTSSVGGAKYFGKITCPKMECKASYSVYLTKEKFNCPVCRKVIKINQLNSPLNIRSV